MFSDKFFGIFEDICDFQRSIENEWVPDWDNRDEHKFVIKYNREKNKFYSAMARQKEIMLTIYFRSKQNASNAIKLFGDDLLEEFESFKEPVVQVQHTPKTVTVYPTHSLSRGTVMSKPNVDRDIVKNRAEELMKNNAVTTTLEVKKSLRDDGYFVTQDEISAYMNDLLSEQNWTFDFNGKYREYKLNVIDIIDDEDDN